MLYTAVRNWEYHEVWNTLARKREASEGKKSKTRSRGQEEHEEEAGRVEPAVS